MSRSRCVVLVLPLLAFGVCSVCACLCFVYVLCYFVLSPMRGPGSALPRLCACVCCCCCVFAACVCAGLLLFLCVCVVPSFPYSFCCCVFVCSVVVLCFAARPVALSGARRALTRTASHTAATHCSHTAAQRTHDTHSHASLLGAPMPSGPGHGAGRRARFHGDRAEATHAREKRERSAQAGGSTQHTSAHRPRQARRETSDHGSTPPTRGLTLESSIDRSPPHSIPARVCLLR